ncbi:hypothetical protein PC110_g19898 [Phytophthora cactorum]|uniref:RxLR effector protein n=1 Tax=Phytophthora cactorum TaxID=29920 RepID=A0A329RKD4_9STRA|nr:hypothetical protein PC110_g19898 [Phytophthora cactorum]
MRLCYILLLPVVTFLASVGVASPVSSSGIHPLTAIRDKIVDKRHLRAEIRIDYDNNNASDEERGLPLPVAGQLASTSPYKAKLAQKAFELLSLDKRKGFLFGSPNLKTWSDLMLKLDKNDPKGSMTDIMSIYYGENALARYIQSAKVSPSMGKLATDLQTAQFAKWARRGETTTTIANMLKKNQIERVLCATTRL